MKRASAHRTRWIFPVCPVLEIRSEVLDRPDSVLEMSQEQNLVHNEIHEHIQAFTRRPQSPDIELYDRLDMVMSSFTISTFCIFFPECRVDQVLVSQVHPDLFRSSLLIQELQFDRE